MFDGANSKQTITTIEVNTTMYTGSLMSTVGFPSVSYRILDTAVLILRHPIALKQARSMPK